RSNDPGPVHLNLAFRDPLVPDAVDAWPEPLDGREMDLAWTATPLPAPVSPTGTVSPRGGLLVVGDAGYGVGDRAVVAAEAFGWPIVSEPSGNARHGPNAMRLGHLLVERADLRPSSVYVVGRPTLTRGVQALFRDPQVRVHVVSASDGWPDAG